MKILGKDLLLYVVGDGVIGDTGQQYPIACDRTCQLTINSDFEETSTKDNGQWRTFLPSALNYELSGDGLVDYSNTMSLYSLQKRMIDRQGLSFKMIASQDQSDNVIYSGTAYMASIVQAGAYNDTMTFSYTMKGSGILNIENNIPTSGGGGTSTMAQVYRLQFETTADQQAYTNTELIGAEIINFEMEGTSFYKGPEDDEFTSLNPTTGTLTWNFNALAGNRCIIIYKK